MFVLLFHKYDVESIKKVGFFISKLKKGCDYLRQRPFRILCFKLSYNNSECF